MKKEMLVLAALSAALILSGCGGASSGNAEAANTSGTTTESASQTGAGTSDKGMAATTSDKGSTSASATASTPEEQIKLIQDDFSTTLSGIQASLDETKAKVGDTYEGYKQNKSAIDDWYEAAEKASDDLFVRTIENSRTYFRLLGKEAESMEYSEVSDAMQDFYRAVYEDAFSDYYRKVYEDCPSDLYETYYEGVIPDASGTVEYSDYSAELKDFYRNYSDAIKAFYRSYSDAMSDVYRDYSDASSAFYKKNFALEGVF